MNNFTSRHPKFYVPPEIEKDFNEIGRSVVDYASYAVSPLGGDFAYQRNPATEMEQKLQDYLRQAPLIDIPGNEATSKALIVQKYLEQNPEASSAQMKKALGQLKDLQKNEELTDGDVQELVESGVDTNALELAMSVFDGCPALKGATKRTPSKNGKFREPKRMEYKHIPKLSASKFAKFDAEVKIIRRQYNVVTKHDIEPEANYLIISIDSSGSMSRKSKTDFINALLIRLKLLIRQNKVSTIYLSTFEQAVEDKTVVKIESDFDKFNYHCDGGWTEVGEVLKYFERKIKKGRLFKEELPAGNGNIVILNDGQDHVDDSLSVSVPVYAFHLKASEHENENFGLKTVCSSSGGEYKIITL